MGWGITTGNLAGLFRGVLPDPAARRQFDGLPFRTRRGMVPDGRVTLRMAELFVELKFLHWGTTTHSDAHLRHASRCRSVTVRAAKVHGEYVKKASDLDAKFCGTSAAERPGPVESRLAAFGTVRPVVVGHYGELSPFFEELIDAAADSGAEKHWRRMRCDSPAIARGFIVQMLRRSWGMAAFRANARLVTRRLQHIRGTAVPMYADPLSRARRRFRRRRDYASEQHGRNRRSRGIFGGRRSAPQ